MEKALSGLTFGNASRSVDRTKKLPWNVCSEMPLEARTRMTASRPSGRVRTLESSFWNFAAMAGYRAAWKSG